jgi:hypothetical protein
MRPQKNYVCSLNTRADALIAIIDQAVADVSYRSSALKQRNAVASFVLDYNANDEWEPSLLRLFGASSEL